MIPGRFVWGPVAPGGAEGPFRRCTIEGRMGWMGVIVGSDGPWTNLVLVLNRKCERRPAFVRMGGWYS